MASEVYYTELTDELMGLNVRLQDAITAVSGERRRNAGELHHSNEHPVVLLREHAMRAENLIKQLLAETTKKSSSRFSQVG